MLDDVVFVLTGVSDERNLIERTFQHFRCYSTIGKDDDNPEILSLGEGCYFTGTVTHELMHTVGQEHCFSSK